VTQKNAKNKKVSFPKKKRKKRKKKKRKAISDNIMRRIFFFLKLPYLENKFQQFAKNIVRLINFFVDFPLVDDYCHTMYFTKLKNKKTLLPCEDHHFIF
jgi:hypothetical protein